MIAGISPSFYPCTNCKGYTDHEYIGKTKEGVLLFSCKDCGQVHEVKIEGDNNEKKRYK